MARVSAEHGKMYPNLPRSEYDITSEMELPEGASGATPVEATKSDTPLMAGWHGKTSLNTDLSRGSEPSAQAANVSKLRRGARVLTSMKCRIFGIVMFLAFIGIYCFVTLVIQPSIDKRIRDALILRPNASEEWEHPKADIFVKIHFFNVTNPNEAMNKGRPFKLEETGPYVFRLVVNKTDLVWNPNSTVSYRELNMFSFDPNLSTGDEEDIVRTVDVPFLAMMSHLQSGKMPSLLSSWLQSGNKVFTSRNVKDLLWGYKDSLLTKIDYLKSWDILKLFKKLDDVPETFGFLAPLNGTPTSVYNVYTGLDNFSQLNEVHSYDYQGFLNGSLCHERVKLHGSACGAIFPPPVSENSILAFFFGPLFKTFDLEFQQPSSYRGLHTYTFKIPDSQFTLEVPESWRTLALHGFHPIHNNRTSKNILIQEPTTSSLAQRSHICENSKQTGTGQRTVNFLKGVASMEPLSKGAPLFLSFPHFLGADGELREGIEGLKPDDESHRSYLDIHQVTGVTPHFRIRYQINAMLDLKKPTKKTSGGSKVFLPVLWMETTVDLHEESLKKLLYVVFMIKIIRYTVLVTFVVLCILAAFLFLQLVVGVVQHEPSKRNLSQTKYILRIQSDESSTSRNE